MLIGEAALGQIEEFVLITVRAMGEAPAIRIHERITKLTGRETGPQSEWAAVKRLEKKGLLVSRRSEKIPRRGGGSLSLYRITPEGEAMLARMEQIRKALGTPVCA